MALLMVTELAIQSFGPQYLMALTSGPTQPEVEGFQSIGTTDMVDPSTGDFSYNIPLFNVGNYPLNLAYQSGTGMDDEASWAGLGWNVHTGAIIRQMRGMPDDFWGDEITRNVYLRDNFTVGAKVMLGFETFGLDLSDYGVDVGVGFDVNYNTYKGMGLTSLVSASVTSQAGSGPLSLGLSLGAGPEGLNISPNLSFSAKFSSSADKANGAGGSASLGFGFNINSRTGLSGMTLSHSTSVNGTKKVKTKEKNKETGKYKLAEKSASGGVTSNSSSIDLGQPTYSPQIDLPMLNSAGSGRFKIGGAVFGQDIDAAITGYGSKQKLAKNKLVNPAYGYMYSEKATGNLDALHDFNREKDGTFTKEKKNLPLTNYTYDVYTISAQGLGGTFRPYRNDAGYIYDKQANSPSTSIDFGLELGPGNLIDFGIDFTANILESNSKAWTSGNGAANALGFRSNQTNKIPENFHFKLTGEQNVDSDPAFAGALRNDRPVRFDLDTDQKNFETPSYNRFVEANGSKYNFANPGRSNRQPRNTAIYHLTKKQVLAAYPWKKKYISQHAKDHHIAEIVVIQPDGTRYIFGLAAYNTKQREMSFNTGAGGAAGALSVNSAAGLVTNASQASIAPGTKRGIDHFYDETVTPAYAHSWLLTEILSPDYVDVKGDGPTDDDLGTYTKFNYGIDQPDGTIKPDIANFKWRTPTMGPGSASYMEGMRTDLTDDKGSIVYGEKEVWYVHSIESKTQIAIFETEARNDAVGANIEGSLQTAASDRLRRLKSITLYSKQEYQQPFHTAVPIKTVHLEHDYSLCPDVPNNYTGGGKLTLNKVYFTYKDSKAGMFSPYTFDYRRKDAANNTFKYDYNKIDRWGVPKPDNQQPSGLNQADWPYATQDKAKRDDYSSAWHLNKITLPSGGLINIKYESDDYGFVQDKAAMRMFKIDGLADNRDGTGTNTIFPNPASTNYRDYIILTLNDPSTTNSAQFRAKYLQGQGKGNFANSPANKYLYYRFLINVNNGLEAPEYEYVSGYAELDINDCGISPSSGKAYIKVKRVATKISGITENVSPFAYSAWQFSRLNTPRKAFNQPEPTDNAMEQIVQTLASADMVSQIIQFFQGPNGRMKAQGFGSKISTAGCWVRLLEPDKTKLGGNTRVKEITISDEWNTLSSSEPTAQYGQEFSYLDEDGVSTSGVAAYEPGAGADENAWRVPSFYSGPKQILIPEERYYMEEPFGESFFPGPGICYSRVTVKDKTFDPTVTLNKTGKTVHEFYTAYDFPTTYDQTPLEIQPREQGVLAKLFSPNKRRFMTASQGYTVVLNDMHGKQKAVSMYAEGESAPFSYTKYHYKNTNGKLNNLVDVIDRDGKVAEKTIGVEIDFIADMREQTTYSETGSGTGNLATMLFGVFPFTLPTIFFSLNTEKTRFRSATGTKVIQKFGIMDMTETYDKGAYVVTRTTAYDALTGAPLIQEMNNEFKDKYYKLEYPAHWAYSGMGQASENIGFTFTYDGSGPLNEVSHAYLEPGDEVLPSGASGRKGIAFVGNANTARFWVASKANGEKYLINNLGEIYAPGTVKEFTVIRSGHRNMQSTPIGSATTVASPIVGTVPNKKVLVDAASRVIATTATDYSEHWKTLAAFEKPVNDSVCGNPDSVRINALIDIFEAANNRNGSIIYYPYLHDPMGVDFSSLFSTLFDNPACGNYRSYFSTSAGPDGICPQGGAAAGFSGGINTITGAPSECACPFTVCMKSVPSPYNGGHPQPPPSPAPNPNSVWLHIDQFTGNYFVNGTTYPTYDPDVLVVEIKLDNGAITNLFIKISCLNLSPELVCSYFTEYVCQYETGDKINPYLYGILGNWRKSADYFFMGDRNNTDATTAENLRTDGYMAGFKPYWKAPLTAAGRWERNEPAVVVGNYENWNWKSQATLYSPYGYDIENINPLPTYSSATYGYLNTLPTAVATNAMQKEIGFDGFEDYYPWITQPACVKGHFRFEDYIGSISSEQAHTGHFSMNINNGATLEKTVTLSPALPTPAQVRAVPYVLQASDVMGGFSPNSDYGDNKVFVLSFWARPNTRAYTVFDYANITPDVRLVSPASGLVVPGSLKKSKIINDWQRFELYFKVFANTPGDIKISIANTYGQNIFVDDIRVHPFDANMKTYVYDLFDMKYMALLDENNFATLYEYDQEGKLVRLKKETERGIMTIQENRTNLYKR